MIKITAITACIVATPLALNAENDPVKAPGGWRGLVGYGLSDFCADNLDVNYIELPPTSEIWEGGPHFRKAVQIGVDYWSDKAHLYPPGAVCKFAADLFPTMFIYHEKLTLSDRLARIGKKGQK